MSVLVAKILTALAGIGGAIHDAPRRLDPPAPMATAIASWYDEDGPGACGTGAQTGLHFASLFLACGARVRFCYAGCAIGTMADHGPYVTGRTFDLNVNLRDAISCTDLCPVRWRLVK
jgi:hypothetical protein